MNVNSKLFKTFKSILRIFTLFYIILVIGIYFLQDQLIFQPTNDSLSSCRGLKKLNASFVNVEFESEKIRFIKLINKASNKTIIVFHGNAGSACHRLDLVHKLKEKNYNYYFYEYPGYAGDESETSEKAIYKNALAFMKYLDQKKLIIGKEILFGESLGTGVATYVTSKRRSVDKLLLQSPYTSLLDIAKSKYPYLPVSLLLKSNFEMKEHVKAVNTSTGVFCGENDKLIPLNICLEQFSRFNSHKEKWIYEKGHIDIRYKNPDFWKQLEHSIDN